MKTPSSKECCEKCQALICEVLFKGSTQECPCPCHTSKEEKSDLNKRFDELRTRRCEVHKTGICRCCDNWQEIRASEIQLERERLAEIVKRFDCKTPHCDNGHYPLGELEDGTIEWGGCPNCVSGRERIEPYKTIENILSLLKDLDKEK